MSRLPRSVEQQAQLADELYNKAYGTPPPNGEAPKAPDNGQPPAPDQNQAPAAGAPNAEPANADQPKPTDQPEEGDLNHWKQRAKVAEGRLSKEMPRMAQTIRELRDQLAASQAKVAELQTTTSSTPPAPAVKPEEVEQYGAEFIDMVSRVARSATPGADPNLVQKVSAVEEQQRKITRQQFFAELVQNAPQWESLNSDEGFLAYLSGLDPYTGRQRQEIFDDAYEKLDAWRVANFFNSYQVSQQANPDRTAPSLADQVVPSGNRSNTPPPSKMTWTNAKIARFYDEVRRGLHKQEDIDRIEKDIFSAQSEGRLR